MKDGSDNAGRTKNTKDRLHIRNRSFVLNHIIFACKVCYRGRGISKISLEELRAHTLKAEEPQNLITLRPYKLKVN